MYITQGSTLPVPFNMLPAPKSARYAWNVIKQLVVNDGNRLLKDSPTNKASFISVRPPYHYPRPLDPTAGVGPMGHGPTEVELTLQSLPVKLPSAVFYTVGWATGRTSGL